MERAGTPATVVITEAFQSVVASHAAKLGMPGYHSLVVPHPIWSRGTDGLRALAQGLAESGLAQLAT